jgi:(p)ppGpp synthase/HD superfamily hydrolase
LTHRKGQSRADYREQVKANMDAVIVKLADIKHNMSRLNNLDDKTHKRLLKKYTEDLIFFGVLPESAREML